MSAIAVVREKETGSIANFRSTPITRFEFLLGKQLPYVAVAMVNFVFLLLMAVELISLPAFGLFYNVQWTRQIGWLLIVLFLGTWALTTIGTMFSALTVNLKLRELMLPTLVYPMMIPALIPAMTLTTDLLAGNPVTGDNYTWVRLLIAFDIIFTSLSVAFVDTVLVG